MAPTKQASKTLVVILSLPKELLLQFTTEEPSSKDAPSPASSNVDSSAAPVVAGVSTPDVTVEGSVNGDAAESGTPSSKPDLKRNASQLTVDGLNKSRGKPGPKKKAKVDSTNGIAPQAGGAKQNPKASAGAINANLRALDRSGAQCRKWKRAPFQIKSFTGAMWQSSSTWEAPAKPKPQVDENGNPIGSSQSGSNTPSDALKPAASSIVASERSQNGDTTAPPAVAMSSPAAVAVA